MSSVMRIAAASILAIAIGGFLYGGSGIMPVTAPAASPSPAVTVASPSPSATQVHMLVHDESVIVTATQECDSPYAQLPGGAYRFTCTMTASDPRATGPLTADFTFDVSTPNNTGQGIGVFMVTLQGPDGTWTGPSYQTVIDAVNGPARGLTILAGDGAYEGWVYVFSDDDTSRAGDFDSVGVIYQGPLPPSF
jgi:FlaG/FlaF family flagellin (archaellin)